ncbi:Ig-like domain repeat protein [Thermococcus sp. M36]|nr:Ig-like domain repeat protein [Thermococcus sp. M36]
MKRVPLLITLLLIISLFPPASPRAVENPVQRDVFLHEYFSRVIVSFEDSLRYTLLNESTGLDIANQTLGELELLHEETLFYRARGVNSTVMKVLPPFYEFARELVLLDTLVYDFLSHPSPATAAGINRAADTMEALLDSIDSIRLADGTRNLTFKTGKLRGYLKEVRSLISQVPPTGEFTIGVSSDRPILYQTVTIFGSCPGNGTVTVVIAGENFTAIKLVSPEHGMFSTTYRFERMGDFRIYAVQNGSRSNTVSVTVVKIPTLFVTEPVYSGLINSELNVTGKLVDYYGSALSGKEVTVGNRTAITGPSGDFSVAFFSRKEATFNVSLVFRGDRTHAGTSKVVMVSFLRYPVRITLSGPGEVGVHQDARFHGSIDPPLDTPLTVYVNGTPYLDVLPANGSFSFTITPNSTGELAVYVKFPGNEVYRPAVSNTVVLKVTPLGASVLRYWAVVFILLVVAAGMVKRRRLEGQTPSGRAPEEPSIGPGKPEAATEFHLPEDVGDAYRLLREALSRTLGIGMNLTPREALKELEGWEMYDLLREVTLLHEKSVYGGVPLSRAEAARFMEGVRAILRGVGT